jgi:ring-1,2-phenylacetyl-CoA epoxidase subunit PaaE
MKAKFESLAIKKIVKESEDCISIELKIPEELEDRFSYISWQYLTFKKTIDNEEIRRSYSLCSAPYEKTWKVAVKKVYQGVFSTFANDELTEEDLLDVLPPMGNFQLTGNDLDKNCILFAAGSGITPIISILKTMLANGSGTVSLVYGNKGFNEIIFREELESLKNKYMERFRLIHVFSRESLGNDLQKGRIDEEKTKTIYNSFLKNDNPGQAFICGPESMIIGVKKGLMNCGLTEDKIHFELFGTPQKKSVENIIERDELATKVEIIIDNDSTEFDLNSNGPSILDAAQHFGGDLPFACKGGVCCTCKAKVLEGQVEMDVNYALTPEELSEGYVLTCQAHPISKYVKISFDD